MESKDKESKGKKNASQNSFDFSGIMGYPPMGPLSNPFSMLGPNSMFPFFPFPGVPSPGDNILPTDGADWWKMASEQAKKFAENVSELYPGMNSMYGSNPFLPAFGQPTGSRISSTPSPSVSHHKSLHSTPDGLFNGTKQSSNNSSPAPSRDASGAIAKGAGHRESRAGSSRSTRVRTDSESSTVVVSPRNASESSTPVKQSSSSHDQLKKSSAPNDSSLYPSSPFFFPFGPMAFSGMPFPSMFGSLGDYVPPFNNFFLNSGGLKSSGGLGLENQRMSSSSSSSTFKNSSRASQGFYHPSSEFSGPSYFGSKNKSDSSEAQGRRDGSSSSASKQNFSMPGTAARTLSINDHKLQLGAFKSRQDSLEKNKKLKSSVKDPNDFKAIPAESSSPLLSSYFQSESPNVRIFGKSSGKRESSSETISYSQDGAIDLSVKKARMEGPSPGLCPGPAKSHSSSSARQSQPEASNILSALAQSHQMFSKGGGPSSFGDPMSFNMAAALLPHMYENMFYPSSSSSFSLAAEASSKDSDRKGSRRGRKRGEQGTKGRANRSSFISSMMSGDAMKEPQNSLPDGTYKQANSARSYLDRFPFSEQQQQQQQYQHPKMSLSAIPDASAKDQRQSSSDRQTSTLNDLFNVDLQSSLRRNDFSSDTESSDDGSDDWSFGDLKNQESRKRKRENPDESLLKAPLESGWQRETRITGLTSKKIVGQVAYETPSGLRVLTFDDVEKFLQSTQNTELSRRNFSFNTGINLGKFFEQRTNEKGQYELIPLSEKEVDEKFSHFEARRKRSTEKKKMKMVCQQMHLQRLPQLQDFYFQGSSGDRDASRKPEHSGCKSTTTEDRLLDDKDVLAAKQMRSEANRMVKEMQRKPSETPDRNQQQQQQQQQTKMHQDSSKIQTLSSDEKERKQFGFAKDQERERRRHYLLLVKAIDARKKEEEKERTREEKRCAKKLDREKKMEQRRMELHLTRELKKPAEDQLLQDSMPLPDFDRIPGLKLPGKAFADCLMVLEFVHNFSSNLKLESEMLPTMSTLHDGLLNRPSSSKSFTDFIIHILKLSFEDPGFPNPREAVTISGQKISDVEITKHNVSELLRVFIRARNGKDDEMAEWLRTKPFYSLNLTQKTTIILYICHELLTSKTITNEIEKSIDVIGNLKKDKWLIEGRLRKFRMMQAKQLRRTLVIKSQTNDDSNATTTTVTSELNNNNNNNNNNNKKDTDDEHSVPDDSNDDEAGLQNHDSEIEEDQMISAEELESKIDKLTKQYNNLQDKVLSLSYKLSIVPLGQDRYRRLYWVLPKCGGIFVEGMESAEPEEADLTTDFADAPPKPPELPPPVLEPLGAENGTDEPSNASNPPTPISCCSKTNEPCDLPDGKAPSSSDAKAENPSGTNGATGGERTRVPPDVKMAFGSANDMSDSTITNLEDIIARTVMNSMMEDEGVSPYNDPPSPGGGEEKTFSEKLEAKKRHSEVDLISKFLASSDNEDDRGLSTRGDQIGDGASEGTKRLDSEASRREAADDFDVNRKKLVYSIDRGSWFSLFARVSPCTPRPAPVNSASSSSFVVREIFLQEPRSLLDRSISSTPTANSRSSTPINPRTNYDDDSSYADWETKADDAGDKDKQDVPAVPLDKQRGWWKISDSERTRGLLLSLNGRGIREKNLQKSLEKNFNFICQSSFKPKKNIMKLEPAQPGEESSESLARPLRPDRPDSWDVQLHRSIELEVLCEIENLEEKVCNASLQGWRMSPRSSQDASENLVVGLTKDPKPGERHIVDVARDKLLHLEHNVERRYLKPPLGRSNHLNLTSLSAGRRSSSSDDDSDCDEEAATKELMSWRTAVMSATSASQLSLYLVQLNRCIAWEKSIMKVSCQICCCDDNEAELLLCDMCDRGYHTYCIKPRLQSIPEGDWFCYECISKASGDACCMACGKPGGRLVACDLCKKRTHSSCLDPPLNRVPKKWSCNACLSEKRHRRKHCGSKIGFSPSMSSSSPLSSSSSSAPCVVPASNPSGKDLQEHQQLGYELNGENTPTSDEAEKTRSDAAHQQQPTFESQQPKCEKLKIDLKKRFHALRSSNSSEQPNDQIVNGEDAFEADLSICHIILSEMKRHQDAWPFLTPVSSKQFPTYRKVIRCPVDFQTIAKRLKINHYKSREEFACDARLVFNNCEMFNEDDSTVGRAGHSMQNFFEKRWTELVNERRGS